MNVSLNTTMDYENISDWTLGENKPKQSQSQKQKSEGRVSASGRVFSTEESYTLK